MEHEVIAVGVRQERHLTDARIENFAVEFGSSGLKLGPGASDIVTSERPGLTF